MSSKLGLFCALLTTVLASPIDRELAGIQCHCLALSMDTAPSACTTLGFQSYSLKTAQSLASKHNLKLEFASQAAISTALSADLHLSDLVLWTASHGEVDLYPAKQRETENKMICGYGDEVRNMSRYGRAEPQSRGLGQVLGVLMLAILAYVVGEYIWTRCQEKNVRLDGEEQPFTCTVDSESQTPWMAQLVYAPVDGKDSVMHSTFS